MQINKTALFAEIDHPQEISFQWMLPPFCRKEGCDIENVGRKEIGGAPGGMNPTTKEIPRDPDKL